MKNIWVVITILVGIQFVIAEKIEAWTTEEEVYHCIGTFEFIDNDVKENTIEELLITSRYLDDGSLLDVDMYFSIFSCSDRRDSYEFKASKNQVLTSCVEKKGEYGESENFMRLDKDNNNFFFLGKFSYGINKFIGKCY